MNRVMMQLDQIKKSKMMVSKRKPVVKKGMTQKKRRKEIEYLILKMSFNITE